MRLLRCFTLLLSLAACAPPISGDVTEQNLDGPMDTFLLTIRVPPSARASPERRYLLQLDGRVPSLMEFDTTARLATELEASGELEEVVIVGINAATGEGSGRGRNRDYTIPLELGDDPFHTDGGGAPAFHQFVAEQLIPFVEAQLPVRTTRDARALFGHSLGGLFGVFSFTEQPGVFGAVVAASPSLVYDAGRMHGVLDALAPSASVPRTLVVTAGTLEGPEMVVPVRTFAQQARQKNFASGLEVTQLEFPVDHINSIEPSFRAGLRVLHASGWDR